MSVSYATKVFEPPAVREVVAAVLTHGNRVCLLRRSQHVHTDAGFWHCVTGFLPRRCDPMAHILVEIAEELGIAARELRLRDRNLLTLSGVDGSGWRVHVFHYECCHDDVTLNWEHDSVVWLEPGQVSTLRTVSWLESVLSALEQTLPGMPLRTAKEA